MAASILIDVAGPREAAWVADLVLRSRAFGAVVVDGRGMDLILTRRLQLAAEGGAGLALVDRAAREVDALSAAGTRWMVRPAPSPALAPTPRPRSAVHLLRRKGLRPAPGCADGPWTVELDRATGALDLVPGVADRPGAATREGRRPRLSFTTM